MDNNKIDDEIKKASKQESFLVRLQEKLAKFKGARTSETKLFGKKAAVVKEKQMEKS